MEKVTVRCKHGLMEGTCSLCLGYPQTGAPTSSGGLPSWWSNSCQLAIRLNWPNSVWGALPGLSFQGTYFSGRGRRHDTKSRRRRSSRTE